MKKKILIVTIALGVLVISGCTSTKEKEALLTKYAREYYETYKDSGMSQMDVPEVSIANLKQVNDTYPDTYDLSELSSCTDESKAVLTITDGSITDVTLVMSCK